MARWQFNPSDNTTYDYPSLGFRAAPGQVCDATSAPDARWSSVAGTTPVSVMAYAAASSAVPTPPADGSIYTYSAATGQGSFQPGNATSVQKGNALVDVVTDFGAKVDGTPGGGGTDDTAAWQNAVTAVVAAGGGTVMCSRQGISKISGAQQTGTAFGYTYSGQILFPAVAGTAGRVVVRLMGPLAPPGPPNGTRTEPAFMGGVILLSNATSGNIFDVVPGFSSQASNPFSNIKPMFERITVRGPSNPQCGGLNLVVAEGFGATDLTVDVNAASNALTYPTGSGVALTLPGINNNADVTGYNLSVTGWPVAYLTAEHAVLTNPKSVGCGVAFRHAARNGHKTIIRRGLVQQTSIVVQAVNSGVGGGTLEGDIDTENDGAPFNITCMVDDQGNRLQGDLSILVPPSPTVGFSANGAQAYDVHNPYYGNVGQLNRLPVDTFTRTNDVANSMGLSDQTCSPWVSFNGALQTSAGKAQIGSSGVNSRSVMRYRLRSYGSRTVTAQITTGSTNDIGVITNMISAGAKGGCFLLTRLLGTSLYIQRFDSGAGTYTSLASSTAGIVATATTYTVDTVLAVTPAGITVTAYLNGVQAATYALTGTDLAFFVEAPTVPVGQKGDGLWINTSDVGSYCSLFRVAT